MGVPALDKYPPDLWRQYEAISYAAGPYRPLRRG